MMRRWRFANSFNNNIKDVKYVLIIPHTKRFHLEEDLQYFLKRKFKMFQFKKILTKLQCIIVYFTVFSTKEKRTLGPIADDTCFKICFRLLNNEVLKKYSNVKIVGPINYKKKMDIISFEQFINCYL